MDTNNQNNNYRLVRGLVKGLVQGVGYRAFTRRVANELKLAGWVKNNYDGSVEFEVFGPKDSVGRFLETLRVGPRLAQVDILEITSDTSTEDKNYYHSNDFQIRY